MNDLTYPEKIALLTPLLDAVFPTAGITVSLDERGFFVLTWKDGPSIPQVKTISRPIHYESIHARRYTVKNLRTIALQTMRTHLVSPEGLRITTRPNGGAVLASHRDVKVRNGGPILSYVEDWTRETSFYMRPAEGRVLRECSDGFDMVNFYHPECYARRLRPLTLDVMSGEPLSTRDGTIRVVPLREIDPHTLCDLTGCGRLIGEEANMD